MVNVGVKASDIGFQSVDSGRTAASGVKNAQSEQFKKLLQGKREDLQESNTKEVSRDSRQEQTEAADKSEKPEKTEEVGDKNQETKEEHTEETVNTDDSQARGLLAAYQMDQGFRPELLTAEPEVVIEIPEGVEMPAETTAADMAGEMLTADTAEQTGVQNTVAEIAAPVSFQAEVKSQETVQVKEAVQTEAPEAAVEAAPIQRESVKNQSAGEDSQTQSNDDHQAEQTAAAPVAQTPVRDMGEEMRPQEVTTVHVAQPEELPDKLTDQILSKMAEGTQSFEIEIEPENLGKIAVKILYEDGQATVSIFCTEKKALDVLGNHARDIGNIIDRNLGGETKIIVEKQEPDYLNQSRDENQQGRQNEQEQKKESNKKQETEDPEQFLQKLRLGLMG